MFLDGTQICWNEQYRPDDYTGAEFFWGNWTFPKRFTGESTSFATRESSYTAYSNSEHRGTNITTGDSGSTSVQIRGYKPYDRPGFGTYVPRYRVLAIGRWK